MNELQETSRHAEVEDRRYPRSRERGGIKKMNEKENETTSGPQREFHLHISQHLEMKMYKLKAQAICLAAL